MAQETPEKLDYIFSVTVNIFSDKDRETYKTEMVFDVNKNIRTLPDQTLDIPRELMLALIEQMRHFRKLFIDEFGITDEEMDEFLKERKLIGTDMIPDFSMINLEDEDDEDKDEEDSPDNI